MASQTTRNGPGLTLLRYLLSRNEDEPEFIYRIVTQNETWVHHFDPKSKKLSMQWKHPGSPPPKKFKKFSREDDGFIYLG
jgi:hypothetical protein